MFLPENLKKENDNMDTFLTVIDVFSKYAWVTPLPNKSVDVVAKAFKSIFDKSGRKPLKLWTDRGDEFTGLIDQGKESKGSFECKHCKKKFTTKGELTQHVNKWCPLLIPEKAKEDKTRLDKDLFLYHTEGTSKATIAERCVKTIKEKMWKYMTNNATKRIIDALPQLVNEMIIRNS